MIQGSDLKNHSPFFLYDTRVPNLCHFCAKTYGNRQNIPKRSEGYKCIYTLMLRDNHCDRGSMGKAYYRILSPLRLPISATPAYSPAANSTH